MTGDRPQVPGGRRSRLLRAGGLVLALVVLIGLVAAGALAVSSTARAAAKAPFVLADALGASVPRPWAPAVERREVTMGDVVADRYSPGSGAPPLVLVPGAARAGREDERVVAVATSLARAGREVLVPELSLYDRRLDVDDVERVVEVAAALCPSTGGLVLLGFSYGGSLALLAAADDRIADCVELVATFGAYVDLVGVLEAAATGASIVEGVHVPWRAHEPARARSMLQDAAVQLVPDQQQRLLRRALRQDDPVGLPPPSQSVYDLVTADEPARVRALVDELPAPQRELIRRLSPAAVAGDVSASVLAVHAADDPAVPYAELLRLEQAFPEARTATVESFRHVDVSGSGDRVELLQDLVAAVRFMAAVLRPQE